MILLHYPAKELASRSTEFHSQAFIPTIFHPEHSFMKILLIVIVALVTGAIGLLGLGYVGAKLWPHYAARFMPDIQVDAAVRAREAETKLAEASDQYARWIALGNAALWKSIQADTANAATLATELLVMAERHKDDWNYGNAIHKANSALGMLALRNGDKAAARRHLLASAETKGSPQMNSFGPNMQLADAMLHAGEHEAVLVYFARCRAFWKMGDVYLDTWSSMVRDGSRPHFGANLLY